MTTSRLLLPLASIALAAGFFACNDDVSPIGGSLATGEAAIYIDTTFLDLNASPVVNNRYDARSSALMIGNLNVPDYGSLSCSFVTKLLCITNLPAAVDTVPIERVDSCKILLGIGYYSFTGDSLAPQQISVYKLEKQLPNNIDNTFVPTSEYYNPVTSLLGKKNFTVSNIAIDDTLRTESKTALGRGSVWLSVRMPDKMAKDIFRDYKENPQVFEWPETFADRYLPGLYVKPTFGNGCVANISTLQVYEYFHNPRKKTTVVDGSSVVSVVQEKDSLLVFSNAPEVLSSNNISYIPSESIRKKITDGETIITTPGGYEAKFRFPAEEVISKFKQQEHNLTIVSSLSLAISAEPVENNYGLGVAPYMMMIKTSEIEDFFANNRIPDNKTSFYSTYDSVNKRFMFSSLRSYLMTLIEKGNYSEEDLDFSLIPVQISTEDVSNSYYGSTTTYVTKCVPYTYYPTMTSLDTKNARVIFTFSSQVIE